jgi:hypothetical protein
LKLKEIPQSTGRAMHFLRPLISFTILDYQRNSDIRGTEIYIYSLINTRIPTELEKSFRNNGQRMPFTVGIPCYWQGDSKT